MGMASLFNLAACCACRASPLCSSVPYRASYHSLTMRVVPPFPSCIAASIRSSVDVAFSSRSVTGNFSWEDVFSIPQSDSTSEDSCSYLEGYFEKVKLCNRGSEKQYEFVPFVIEDQIVGFIHSGFADRLRASKDVFIFPKDKLYGSPFDEYVSLNPILKTPERRTSAVGNVIKCLGEEWIPGIRNEAYGVHMNGYVEQHGQKHLWIGKRSRVKPTYPGMLDHLAAGGLPHGIDCQENLAKECEEEAGIPRSISNGAIPVGAVSYMDIDGYRYKRDVLFCYDLKLPESFEPKNEDGEVDSFKLIPITQIAEVIRKTQFFKPNCSLVIIDFLFRHGYINPERLGYLDLLRSLRAGDCS
ncbi:nudix hydrolase 20, chloroplastic-like isoform X2 [Prosopis cineraria]|uniref:nudix hydrolase 20, chloroplastic-like isoform X2 n=1 Tax=Prosopis cineraria TaxID=364024 RepID=UPI0024105820|nr:nudix hydrolase 20, chloroplastic-like isoform X2 [Prosopis cineraria]